MFHLYHLCQIPFGYKENKEFERTRFHCILILSDHTFIPVLPIQIFGKKDSKIDWKKFLSGKNKVKNAPSDFKKKLLSFIFCHFTLQITQKKTFILLIKFLSITICRKFTHFPNFRGISLDHTPPGPHFYYFNIFLVNRNLTKKVLK